MARRGDNNPALTDARNARCENRALRQENAGLRAEVARLRAELERRPPAAASLPQQSPPPSPVAEQRSPAPAARSRPPELPVDVWLRICALVKGEALDSRGAVIPCSENPTERLLQADLLSLLAVGSRGNLPRRPRCRRLVAPLARWRDEPP